MKKLRLYDHLGQLVKEFDVYVEGQSFVWRSPKPEAIWLGTISLQDPDEKLEEVEEVAPELTLEPEYVPLLQEEAIQKSEEIMEEMREQIKLEEVGSELEKPDDKSVGDNGVSETEQPEKLTPTPEVDTTRQVVKRGKGHRKPKSAKGAVGSRSRKRTPKSSRGKAKGANAEEVS